MLPRKKIHVLKLHLIWLCWVSVSLTRVLPTHAADVVMTEDGAWCWFQDPRAVFVNGTHTRTYVQWVTQDAQLQIGAYDHESGKIKTHTLKEQWGADDHNVGAFIVLPDKRLLVFYAQHNGSGLFCRTSVNPEDISQWEDEVTINAAGRISYAHPVYLSDEKTFYVFWRAKNLKPTVATSKDAKSWSAAATLIQDQGRSRDDSRPYTKIVSDGKSTIHFAFTDGHPRNESYNSVYYMRYEGGQFFTADNQSVGCMNALPIPHRKSEVIYNGKTTNVRAWVWDIALDDEGLPVIAYTRFPSKTDHRYCYARWTGKKWRNVELVAGGGWFPQTPKGKIEPEPHYSGGMALDHSNPSTLYLSRQVEQIFEVEKWDSPDKGASWCSFSITPKSQHLNVRPVVPRGYGGPTLHLLWMFGDYEHYTKFNTGIMLLHDRK